MTNAVEVRTRWAIESEKVLGFGLWMDAVTPWTIAELQDAADAAVAEISVSHGGQTVKQMMDNSTVFGKATAQEWTVVDGILVPVSIQVLSATAGGAAVDTGGQPPPQARVVARLRTANPARSARGRAYLPACTEESMDDPGTISTGMQNSYQVWIEDLITSLEAAVPGRACGILSRKFNSFETPIVDVSVDLRVRSQRRGQIRARLV